MSHRVRSLIGYLDYGELSKSKILPKEKMFTAKTVPSRGGKTCCPTLAKKLGPSTYGIFMESVITCLLNNDTLENLGEVKKELAQDLQKYFKPQEFALLKDCIRDHFLDEKVTVQAELLDSPNFIEGHPDLLTETCVYDIKTTGRFSAMRTDTIFQLLSYYCLCRINKLQVTSIGLVLPLQNRIVVYDLGKWNWEPFYERLKGAITSKQERESGWQGISAIYQIQFMFMRQHVGSHCRVGDLIKYINCNVPALQFFIAGNVTSTVKYTDKFLKDLDGAMSKSNTRVFIHSPYILNLSHPGKGQGSREEDKDIPQTFGGWTFECIRKLFEFAHQTKIEGIVIHCGKRCKEEYYTCVYRMWRSVIFCSQYASKKCKLLIETSSGQDGEILCSPEELSSFYLSLPDDVRENIGICVDSCHVFSSGYDPYEYITILDKLGVPIDLFHYNDSAVKKGALRDRHACIGRGYIGFESLYKVLDYAIKHNIPLVTE